MSKQPKRGFEDQDFLGGRISAKYSLFKMLGRLGYEEGEQYAMLEFVEWLGDTPDADIITIMKKAVELLGMAHFMALTQEITKLSMILGYTKKTKKWSE